MNSITSRTSKHFRCDTKNAKHQPLAKPTHNEKRQIAIELERLFDLLITIMPPREAASACGFYASVFGEVFAVQGFAAADQAIRDCRNYEQGKRRRFAR